MDGPWFGIEENREFNPASMMKIAVMVAWLKRAEKNPRVLKGMMTYSFHDDMRAMQNIKSLHSAEPGHSYSVDELLRLMMNYSDNNATRLLLESLAPDELRIVLTGMDVNNRLSGNGQNSISVHGYSGFFRILYNASFLNREMSEKALQLLSLDDFPQGISAGVPKGTVVASKFGESSEGARNEVKQLHEFGIVYHPKHPYLIGIMTKGRDFDKLAAVIQGISRHVYAEVDAEKTLTGDR
jgi:beta-lactamase class A